MSSRFPSRVPGTLPLPPPPGDWYVTVESLKSLLRTINGQSLVGKGDIAVSGGGSSITIDPEPTSGSTNAVMSKGVYDALAGKQTALGADQLAAVNSGATADKVSAWDAYAAAIAGKQTALSDEQLAAANSGATAELVTKWNGYEATIAGKQTQLSEAQLAAANSGATSEKVTAWDAYAASKQDKLDTTQMAAVNSGITASKVASILDAPSAAGTLGQYLQSDGAGGTRWRTVPAGGDTNAVHYASDGTRTDGEKEAARSNIGAASEDDLTTHTGNSSVHLTTAQAARVAQASRQCSTMPTTSEGIENGEVVLYTGATTSSYVCGTYYRATTHAAGFVVRPGTGGYPTEGATLYCTEDPLVTKTSSVLIQLYTDIDRTEAGRAVYLYEATGDNYDLVLDYFDPDDGSSIVLADKCYPSGGQQPAWQTTGTTVTAIPTVEWTPVANWLAAPSGGTAGQVLTKTAGGTAWQDPSAQVTVDSALSTTSANPVQNKVVTAAVDAKRDLTNRLWTAESYGSWTPSLDGVTNIVFIPETEGSSAYYCQFEYNGYDWIGYSSGSPETPGVTSLSVYSHNITNPEGLATWTYGDLTLTRTRIPAVNLALSTEVDAKQGKLTAGDGVSIYGNYKWTTTQYGTLFTSSLPSVGTTAAAYSDAACTTAYTGIDGIRCTAAGTYSPWKNGEAAQGTVTLDGTNIITTGLSGGYDLYVRSLGKYESVSDCAIVLLPSGTIYKPSQMVGNTYKNVAGFIMGDLTGGAASTCYGTNITEIAQGSTGVYSTLNTRYFKLTGNSTITMLSGSSCLHPDTLITMADGSQKRIAEVKVGDTVLATDPETHEWVADEVVFASGVHGNGRAVEWTFADGTRVVTVNRHRFYNVSLMEFCYIQAWEPGEAAFKYVDGSYPVLVSSRELGDSPHATIFTRRFNNYLANGLLCGNRHSTPLKWSK